MKHGFKTLTAIIAGVATMLAAGVPAAMADSTTPALGIPIHSRSVKPAEGDGVYAMTYEVQGKSNPSVVHLGGDVVVAYDSSGSMGELAGKVKASSSSMASKSLAGLNPTLPDAQQNKVAFLSMPSTIDGDDYARPLKNASGGYWFNDSKTFDRAITGYTESCGDCDALDFTAKEIAEIAKTGRAKAGSRDAFIITDGVSTDGESSPENLKKYFSDGSLKDWAFHLVQVNDPSGSLLAKFGQHLKDAGAKSVEVIDESQMQKVFDKLGADQATSWRVANVNITDRFGPYVDPVDLSKVVVTCNDRTDISPGEDNTGCDKAPKPEEVKTTWDSTSRTLTVAWPTKKEIGAKTIYDVTVNVKVNADGIKHYEDSGYKYDGDKGEADTGATSAGKDGYFVSKSKAQLNYEFFRNGVSVDEKKNTDFATPVIQVGTLEATLSYDSNGGEGTMEDQTGEHAASVKAEDNKFTWKGHRFLNWNTKPDGSGSMVKPGDDVQLNEKTQTLYAQWTTMPATVSYDKNSGAAQGTTDGAEGLDGDEITIAENGFTWAGRTFLGWNDQADGKGNEYKPGDKLTLKEGDLVLYAQWKANGSTLSYLPGSDKAAGETPSETGNVDDDVKVSKNGFTWTGHTFLGWRKTDKTPAKDSAGKADSAGKDDAASTDKPDDSASTDDSTDSTAEPSDGSDTGTPVDGSDTTDKPSTDDSKPSADGASTHAEGKVKVIDSKDTTDGKDDFTTTDKPATDDTTSGDKPSTDNDSTDSSTDKKPDSSSDSTSSKDDKTDDKTDSTGDSTSTPEIGTDSVVSGKTDESDEKLAKDLKLIMPGDTRKLTVEGETLEAVWRANTYTVKFDKNDNAAGGETPDQQMEYDKTTKLTKNGFTYALHNFKGWNTKSDGSGTTYKDEAEVTNLVDKDKAEITLYAQWEAQPLPLTGVAVGLLGAGMLLFGFVGVSALTFERKRRRN